MAGWASVKGTTWFGLRIKGKGSAGNWLVIIRESCTPWGGTGREQVFSFCVF